jgi:hypothetical protein
MSLATLNKQRQPQSIKTTVTISKVSKTPIESNTPIMSQSRRSANDSASEKSEPSIASNDSLQTVREVSKSSVDEIPFADESIVRKKELAKEKFMNESAAEANERRGELETKTASPKQNFINTQKLEIINSISHCNLRNSPLDFSFPRNFSVPFNRKAEKSQRESHKNMKIS